MEHHCVDVEAKSLLTVLAVIYSAYVPPSVVSLIALHSAACLSSCVNTRAARPAVTLPAVRFSMPLAALRAALLAMHSMLTAPTALLCCLQRSQPAM